MLAALRSMHRPEQQRAPQRLSAPDAALGTASARMDLSAVMDGPAASGARLRTLPADELVSYVNLGGYRREKGLCDCPGCRFAIFGVRRSAICSRYVAREPI